MRQANTKENRNVRDYHKRRGNNANGDHGGGIAAHGPDRKLDQQEGTGPHRRKRGGEMKTSEIMREREKQNSMGNG